MHPMVKFITTELKRVANPDDAGPMQAYMKATQPFYGVKSAQRREVFKRARQRFPLSSRAEYEEVIWALWRGKYREDMYQALEVVEYYKVYRNVDNWPLYEALVFSASHWDTLDWIAGKLVSHLLLKERQFEKPIKKWTQHDSFWVRRASLLAHLHHKDQTNKELLAKTILQLAHEEEFFIRKAIGWVLRELSKTDPKWVRQFVQANKTKLSSLSQREALKHI